MHNHLTFFLITKKNFQGQVIFKNLIVDVTTNQYQYNMKNESSQSLIHSNKLLFCWKYMYTMYNHKWQKPPVNILRENSCASEGDQHKYSSLYS